MALPKAYRPLIARYGGGKFDKWARRNYGVTGYGLLARLIKGESGFDQSAVSDKGARSITQFIPSTRRAFIEKYNVDPWKDKASAVRAAKIHLMKWGGLRGYNPGMASYPSYILNQNVGNTRRELRRTGHLTGRNEYTGKGAEALRRQGGTVPGNLPARGRVGGGHGGSGGSRAATGSAASLRQLITAGPTATPVAGETPEDPPFSARAFLQMPETARDVPGTGVAGPVEKPDIAALLSTVTPQSPVPAPTALQPAALGVGTGAAPPPGGWRGSPSRRGTPKPLNPRRFQLGKSGRTAVQRTGKNAGESIMWNGRRWVYHHGGAPVRGLKWSPHGGMNPSGGMYPDLPGGAGRGPTGAPIDRAGVRTNRDVRRFVEALSREMGSPIQYGTGTAHPRLTSSGNVSDHWVGQGIDLPMAGRRLRIAGTKALRLAGLSRPKARQLARQGGIYNVNYKGKRYQIIVRTADHWDHLHVGVR